MKISMIGTGYVGLVTGTCFSEMGNDVTCADINQEKVDDLKKGIIPIFEPGLEELVKRNYREERLNFTIDVKLAVEKSLFIFIAVDTPSKNDGSPNLERIEKVAQYIGKYINCYKIIVNKSTVPVGTADLVQKIIREEIKKRGEDIEFDIVSNPEFLKEGSAVDDFMKPDRVVIGTDNVRTAEIMKELYAPFVRNDNPIIIMDIKSAEMTKYAANAFMATKISFINEIANLCEVLGADVANVKKGIASDSRIGGQFLFPGVGYGGSCLPKDVKIINHTAKDNNYPALIFDTINKINEKQKSIMVNKVLDFYKNKDYSKLNITIWGLAFKPQTDDIREAPSIVIINSLLEKGFKINVYDPEAINNVKNLLGDSVKYFDNMYDALENADSMILVTEWMQFRKPDFDKIKSLMKSPVVFDGRNQYEPENMKKLGFKYFCIGRPQI